MKISIITASYNSSKTIKKTLDSVKNQSYSNIEHIIIDGLSSDNTISIVNTFSHVSKVVVEKDNGIYDAINKGIKLATGEIVGILNSDDEFFDNDVISNVSKAFAQNNNLDSIIGDIIFIKNNDQVHRKYTASNWNPNKFAWGMMPPHPTFYCKKSIFEKFGFYRTEFKIAADYELMMRFLLINDITYKYIPNVFVKMSLGGASTKNLKNKIQINKEVLYACRINNVKTNFFKIYSKYFKKILEFL